MPILEIPADRGFGRQCYRPFVGDGCFGESAGVREQLRHGGPGRLELVDQRITFPIQDGQPGVWSVHTGTAAACAMRAPRVGATWVSASVRRRTPTQSTAPVCRRGACAACSAASSWKRPMGSFVRARIAVASLHQPLAVGDELWVPARQVLVRERHEHPVDLSRGRPRSCEGDQGGPRGTGPRRPGKCAWGR